MKYVQGNLLTALQSGKLDVIAHQTNCFCKGRRGIAPQIFNAFPEAKLADDKTEVGDASKMGNFTVATTMCGGRVYNLYGQYHFDNRKSDYGTHYPSLQNSLYEMACDLREVYRSSTDDTPIRVGFPLIGCGLAGGDWNRVSEFIKNAFDGPEYDVYIYTLNKMDGVQYV